MDSEQLMHLTDQERERYNTLLSLFDHPGWAMVTKWAEGNSEESRDRAAFAVTWEDNRLAVGSKIVYDLVAKMPEITEIEYEALARQRQEDREESEIVRIELEHE